DHLATYSTNNNECTGKTTLTARYIGPLLAIGHFSGVKNTKNQPHGRTHEVGFRGIYLGEIDA
ncbi:MAG: hypothetical protein KAH97_03205, partial [Anaerolineales bacterium]|nr:hypothetical protein [Anaerolineales bacterium]